MCYPSPLCSYSVFTTIFLPGGYSKPCSLSRAYDAASRLPYSNITLLSSGCNTPHCFVRIVDQEHFQTCTEHGRRASRYDPVPKAMFIPLVTIMFVTLFLIKCHPFVTNFEKLYLLHFKPTIVTIIRKSYGLQNSCICQKILLHGLKC